ncbi:hypothetical protein [Roseimicrobium sp. ORNL1]|uniref:hypothetical protein n=1 Tax=Roseimicrobium sp. ORNL1 TaxID=2711231 RepID=UPI0013E144CA|nr:hypothetical protein [Roseimicrobium sp. ORNL1]QIF04637.1 hypothetical protein G5S37_24945 [Roseimicrobium sp. ORNL1]
MAVKTMADFHPAFEVPPGNAQCCHCLGLPANTCPDFAFQGKQCIGTPNGVMPCGFFNPEDGKFYLEKTVTNSREVRTVSPAPHVWECETSGGSRRVTVGTVDVEIPYDSRANQTCAINVATLACECSPDVTESSYTLTRQVVRLYDVSDTDCNGDFLEVPGAFITELDVENSIFDETEYNSEWTQPGHSEIQGSAVTNSAANCSEEFGDTPIGLSYFLVNEETSEVLDCLYTSCETRIVITGGNSGYIRIVYGVMDENSEIIENYEIEHEWDPTLGGADAEYGGPTLTAAWPTGEGSDTLYSRELVLIEYSCVREEE